MGVYGGFEGDESARADRDWETNVTILSGDIDEDGEWDADNSLHVVNGVNAGTGAVLDGFIIERGYADDNPSPGGGFVHENGGGYWAYGSNNASPTIENCTFRYNHAASSGGAIYNHRDPNSNTLIVTNCVFIANDADGNHGVYAGGAIYNSRGGNGTFTNCRFLGNDASNNGNGAGGAVGIAGSISTYVNCAFSGNTAGDAAGALYVSSYSGNPSATATLKNCSFSGNEVDSTSGGGALYAYTEANQSATLTVSNGILWGDKDNCASSCAASEIDASGAGTETVTVTYTDIEGGYSGTGNIDSDPFYADADGADNTFGTLDDNLRLTRDTAAADVGDNTANSETTDLDGNARKVDYYCQGDDVTDIIDMGAYELHSGIIYADASAGGDDTGTSWTNAYPDLQSAFTAARGDATYCEIRVGQGTYKPNSCVDCAGIDREDAFELINNVTILGGYQGNSGTGDPGERNVDTYETILSGSLATGYNSYHVVSADDTIDSTAVLDGFTIQLGIADGSNDFAYGGGLFIDGGAPTINDCTFTGNSAGRGGGAYLENDSQADFTDCLFEDATADNGGGMFIYQAKPTLTACNFTANDAPENGAGTGQGAGVYISDGTETYDTDPLFERCRFNSNLAELLGGGVFVDGPGGGGITAAEAPVFVNCLFYSNEATDNSASKGGAIYCERKIEVYGCTLARNKTGVDDTGGGIYNFKGDSVIKNCILWRNRCASNHDDEPDQIYVAAGTLTVTNTCIENLDTWPGNDNISTNPQFTDLNGDNYVLLSTGCGDEICDSDAIDASDNTVNCNGGDFRGPTYSRCVELEGHGVVADMGCYETAE